MTDGRTKNRIAQLISPPWGSRRPKPRFAGITMVMDKGLGSHALEDLLTTAGPYIDYLKLAFGSSCLYPAESLQRKLDLCHRYAVRTCTGGTLAEIAIAQGKFERMVDTCLRLGFTAIEVSDGTLPVTPPERRRAIRYVAERAVAISEVGKKLAAFPAPADVVQQVLADLEAGASYVVIEGRETGENVGIYGATGEIAEDVLDAWLARLPREVWPRIIWEAPKKSQQVRLLERFGCDVNLGNIPPADVLALESLRQGLRGDTLVFAFPSSGRLHPFSPDGRRQEKGCSGSSSSPSLS